MAQVTTHHVSIFFGNRGGLQTLSTRMDFHELTVLLLRFLRHSFAQIMAGSQTVLHETRRRLGSDKQQRETRETQHLIYTSIFPDIISFITLHIFISEQ